LRLRNWNRWFNWSASVTLGGHNAKYVEQSINQLRYQEVSDGYDMGRRSDGQVKPGNRTERRRSWSSTRRWRKDLSDTIGTLWQVFVPFTPRTRTQPRPTPTGSKCTTNKWICNEEIAEDEPVTDQSNGIATVWQDVTSPTQQPKYPTPSDQVVPANVIHRQMEEKTRW